MDNTWHVFGLYFGLDFLGLCSGHPIDPRDLSGTIPFAGPLLGFALLVASIICLAACVCCRGQQQRKGFKEFTDSTSNQSLNHVGRGITNPGLTPGSELAIFPPPGAVVTFEPLPNIGPSLQTARSRKPPAYNNMVADGLSDTDWFMGPQLDFSRQQLHYLRECGTGWFGRVVEGEAKGLKDNKQSKVVVKILREDATQAEQKFFLNEVKHYRDLNHLNVLKLVGRCLETNPYLILLEACSSGDLKTFLAGNITSSTALVQQGICLRMMCQVASGLQHMVQHGFVHTDLAARNCLVTSDLTVKVGDYGTSIETFKNDYYITEDVAIPIRWCSPETLHCTDTTIETKPVTVAANVWSLGVVLWEICEFGRLPYSELTDDQVIMRVLCQEGVRLGCPTLHPLHCAHLYTLMQMCWQPSNKRPSIEHILAMLLHLQTSTLSDSDEDFERRWETLKPNTIPITDNHVPEVTLETLTAKSDFDSGVDLEIKSTDPEVIDLTKRLSVEGVNLSPSITASPQLSVTSSSGGEFFTSSGLSTIQRHLSPSMTNLRGSIEDITKPVEEKTETVTEAFDSWLKGVDTTSEEDVKFVRKISEAIKDLDDALALEKTSSSEGSSRQESPLKDSIVLDENPVLDFRLGPIPYKDSGMQLDSLQEDSFIRRDSSTDTEEETWRGRIERGEFSEKVKEKSRSVADLMILTHIDNSEGSDESDSLPSLTRQYSIEKVKRLGKPSTMMTSIGFGSEGNIRGAVLGEEFQESLKQLQAEWRIKDSESRENSLVEPESSLLKNYKNDFLCNDASEKCNIPVNSQLKTTVPSQVNIDIVRESSSVPLVCSKQCDTTYNSYCKVNSFIENEKVFVSNEPINRIKRETVNSVTRSKENTKLMNDEKVETNMSLENIVSEKTSIKFEDKLNKIVDVSALNNTSGANSDQSADKNVEKLSIKLEGTQNKIVEVKEINNTSETNGDLSPERKVEKPSIKLEASQNKIVEVKEINNTSETNGDLSPERNVDTNVEKLSIKLEGTQNKIVEVKEINNTSETNSDLSPERKVEKPSIKLEGSQNKIVEVKEINNTSETNGDLSPERNVGTNIEKLSIKLEATQNKMVEIKELNETRSTNFDLSPERNVSTNIENINIKLEGTQNKTVDVAELNNTSGTNGALSPERNVDTNIEKLSVKREGFQSKIAVTVNNTSGKNSDLSPETNVENPSIKLERSQNKTVEIEELNDTCGTNSDLSPERNVDTNVEKIKLEDTQNKIAVTVNNTSETNSVSPETNVDTNVKKPSIKLEGSQNKTVEVVALNNTSGTNSDLSPERNVDTNIEKPKIKLEDTQNKIAVTVNNTSETNSVSPETNVDTNVEKPSIKLEGCQNKTVEVIALNNTSGTNSDLSPERNVDTNIEKPSIKLEGTQNKIAVTVNTNETNSDLSPETNVDTNVEKPSIKLEGTQNKMVEVTELNDTNGTNGDLIPEINVDTNIGKLSIKFENTQIEFVDVTKLNNTDLNSKTSYTENCVEKQEKNYACIENITLHQSEIKELQTDLEKNIGTEHTNEINPSSFNDTSSAIVETKYIEEADNDVENKNLTNTITDEKPKQIADVEIIDKTDCKNFKDGNSDLCLGTNNLNNIESNPTTEQSSNDVEQSDCDTCTECKQKDNHEPTDSNVLFHKTKQVEETFERNSVNKTEAERSIDKLSNTEDVTTEIILKERKETEDGSTRKIVKNDNVFPKLPLITISNSSNFHNFNQDISISDQVENKLDLDNSLKSVVDSEVKNINDCSLSERLRDVSVNSSNDVGLRDTSIVNNETYNFVPEIVVTEASILDIDSEPEETIYYQNISTPRKIRIMVSSSDDSDDDFDDTHPVFASTPYTENQHNCCNNKEIVSTDLSFNDSTESFVVPLSNEFQTKDNESCVILGSCEDYTLDYFKGLKTTFGKPTIDIDSNDELSKSDVDENEDKQKINNWDDYLSQARVNSEENLVYSDVQFGGSISETNDNIDLESGKTFTQIIDSVEIPKKINSDFILNERLVDLNKCVKVSDVCSYEVMNAFPGDAPLDRFDGLNSKDMQMEEVKNRLQDVAKFSQGFCLKGASTSVEDEEDGKFLTPDDERSSDSGFRDKGSLSESVEDACDEKYNLEDIEAELEEVYSKNIKSEQDSPNSSDDQNKTYIITEPSLEGVPLGETFTLANIEDKTFTKEEILKNDIDSFTENKKLGSITEGNNGLVKAQVTNYLDHEDVFRLSFEGEQSDLIKTQDEDRFNKLDSALDSDIDLFFETDDKVAKEGGGWYLHPPVTSDKDEQSNGWLPAPVITEETSKDNSYVSFHIDEEFVTAIRNELREKLPCAQNPERQESEEDVSPEEERTDMVIQYNTYPAPLSPIFEERESLSSNQSSLLLDDQKSTDSSGKSSPVLYLDLPKETERSFEDVIRNEIDVDSESTESDTAIVVVEDLEQKETIKVSENVKEDCDDLLIIDTETNCATLLESPTPKSQLAFVKPIQKDDDNSSGVDSDTYVLTRLGDDSDKHTLYTPDSVSPLSSGSSRTGAAISFSSSETGNLSGFYLSPSSIRSDLFDSGPPSLPFDLGQTFDNVEEICIKPNNEAAEIVQQLVDIGVLKEVGVNNDIVDKGNFRTNVWEIGGKLKSEEVQVEGIPIVNETLTNKEIVPDHNESLDNLISCKKSPLVESPTMQNASESQHWLQSVLLPDVKNIIIKDEPKTKPVSLTTEGWPTVDELLPVKSSLLNKIDTKLENDLTPDSPSIDLNEIVGKCDINSTLALTTPNFSILSDESKDNSQLSSFSSTPTLDTVKSVSEKSTKDSESIKTTKVVPLSVLAENIIHGGQCDRITVNVHDVTPEEERQRKLQGMTLALEPMSISKAPMPSPEDADKGLWRPTIGQLLELTNQQVEQDDMMTTSFIDTDNNDGERYTPDWESDTSDESEEHSSSSGEFIWKDGDREEPVRAVLVSVSDNEGQEEGEEEKDGLDEEARDDSSCGSTTEFVPSSWDSNAIPVKSALRSSEKTNTEKKNVSFKLQKYHCVYEYPKEASESEDEEEDDGTTRRTWQTPTFDYSTFTDWEFREGEADMEGGDSDTEERGASGEARQPPEYDFYRLSGMDFDVGYMTSDDGEFYISSSAKPFHQFLTDEAAGSEFFPGATTESNDDFIVEFNPLASDVQTVVTETDKSDIKKNSIDNKTLHETETTSPEKKTVGPTKPNNLYIPPEPSPSEESSSAEVSPGLGELRHTRQRLKLDLLGTVKGVAEAVKGEASLLDSGEDSGFESNGQNGGQVKLKDSVETSSEA